MTEKTLPLRLMLEGEGDDTMARVIDSYRNLKAGKKLLIIELLQCGQILKECGLLDIVSSVDDTPDYLGGTQSQRRALLLAELASLGGGQRPTTVSAPPAFPVTENTVEPAAPAQNQVKVPKLGR